MKRRTFVQAAAAAAVLPLPAWAQEKYPEKGKVITWICPYAAGGNADIRSRQLSAAMAKIMNKPSVQERLLPTGKPIAPVARSTFPAYLRVQRESWAGKIKDAGIQPE